MSARATESNFEPTNEPLAGVRQTRMNPTQSHHAIDSGRNTLSADRDCR